jgi:hypothetical protein
MTDNAKAQTLKEPVLDRAPITETGELGADMLELLERPVVVWRPDQGDAPTIAGKVIATATALSTFGPYPVIDLDDGRTIWRINVLGQVFAREVGFRQAGDGVWVTKLAPGDMLGIHDPGVRVESKTAGRSGYRLVRVIHRPAQGSPGTTIAPSIGEIEGEIPF